MTYDQRQYEYNNQPASTDYRNTSGVWNPNTNYEGLALNQIGAAWALPGFGNYSADSGITDYNAAISSLDWGGVGQHVRQNYGAYEYLADQYGMSVGGLLSYYAPEYMQRLGYTGTDYSGWTPEFIQQQLGLQNQQDFTGDPTSWYDYNWEEKNWSGAPTTMYGAEGALRGVVGYDQGDPEGSMERLVNYLDNTAIHQGYNPWLLVADAYNLNPQQLVDWYVENRLAGHGGAGVAGEAYAYQDLYRAGVINQHQLEQLTSMVAGRDGGDDTVSTPVTNTTAPNTNLANPSTFYLSHLPTTTYDGRSITYDQYGNIYIDGQMNIYSDARPWNSNMVVDQTQHNKVAGFHLAMMSMSPEEFENYAQSIGWLENNSGGIKDTASYYGRQDIVEYLYPPPPQPPVTEAPGSGGELDPSIGEFDTGASPVTDTSPLAGLSGQPFFDRITSGYQQWLDTGDAGLLIDQMVDSGISRSEFEQTMRNAGLHSDLDFWMSDPNFVRQAFIREDPYYIAWNNHFQSGEAQGPLIASTITDYRPENIDWEWLASTYNQANAQSGAGHPNMTGAQMWEVYWSQGRAVDQFNTSQIPYYSNTDRTPFNTGWQSAGQDSADAYDRQVNWSVDFTTGTITRQSRYRTTAGGNLQYSTDTWEFNGNNADQVLQDSGILASYNQELTGYLAERNLSSYGALYSDLNSDVTGVYDYTTVDGRSGRITATTPADTVQRLVRTVPGLREKLMEDSVDKSIRDKVGDATFQGVPNYENAGDVYMVRLAELGVNKGGERMTRTSAEWSAILDAFPTLSDSELARKLSEYTSHQYGAADVQNARAHRAMVEEVEEYNPVSEEIISEDGNVTSRGYEVEIIDPNQITYDENGNAVAFDPMRGYREAFLDSDGNWKFVTAGSSQQVTGDFDTDAAAQPDIRGYDPADMPDVEGYEATGPAEVVTVDQATAGAGAENMEGIYQRGGVYGYEAVTVSDRMQQLLAQDSPYLQRARLSAEQQANARGLANSTMAATAGEAAAIDASAQIAKFDSDAINDMRKTFTDSINKARSEEVRAYNEANIDYVRRVDDAAAFSASELNKALLDYVSRVDQAAAFSASELNKAALDYAQRQDTVAIHNADRQVEIAIDNARRADELAMANADLEQRGRELYAQGEFDAAQALLDLAQFNAELINQGREFSAGLLADVEARIGQQEFDLMLERWRYATGEESADNALYRERVILLDKLGIETSLINSRGEWDIEAIKAEGAIKLEIQTMDNQIESIKVGADLTEARLEAGLTVLELWELSTQHRLDADAEEDAIYDNDTYWNEMLIMATGGEMWAFDS